MTGKGYGLGESGPDPLVAHLFNTTPPEYRDQVAEVLSTADMLARHVPAHDLPRCVVATWLLFAAIDGFERTDPIATHVDRLAVAVARDVGTRLALLAGVLADPPPDASSLTPRDWA